MTLLTNSHRETSRPILASLGQGTIIFKKVENIQALQKIIRPINPTSLPIEYHLQSLDQVFIS